VPDEAQKEIPLKTFKQLYDKNELGSFQRVYEPLKEYLKNDDIDNCVQTNFCFFRSDKENRITKEDIELSKPLFRKLIEIIAPKKIIGFSSKLRDHFLDNNLCLPHDDRYIKSNNKTLFVSREYIKWHKRRYQFIFYHIQMLITLLNQEKKRGNFAFQKVLPPSRRVFK